MKLFSHQEDESPQIKLLIRRMIEERHPPTVGDLLDLIAEEGKFDELNCVRVVRGMVDSGEIIVRHPKYELSSSLDFLFTPTLSLWFWMTVSSAIVSALACAYLNVYPLSVLRWVMGSLLLFYLPGYALLQFLFPLGSSFSPLERNMLEIVSSLAIVPLIGLLLFITPWGLHVNPVIFALTLFVLIFAAGGAVRKYSEIQVAGLLETV
ncbi:MAG: DUF1616 domain-containing protein [Candidatus Bathyarchaeia archaeon]